MLPDAGLLSAQKAKTSYSFQTSDQILISSEIDTSSPPPYLKPTKTTKTTKFKEKLTKFKLQLEKTTNFNDYTFHETLVIG